MNDELAMKPERIQLSRKKGWRMPPNTVKVARPGKWGNEFRIGDTMQRFSKEKICETFKVRDNAHAVELFRERMRLAFEQHPKIMRGALDELRGRNVACWCRLCPSHAEGKPLGVVCSACDPCHADVLLEIANAK